MLEKEVFAQVVKHTPLVSIDLIVRNSEGHVLVGYRNNEPARHYWFVPGGRVNKNEKLDDAFARITEGELGKKFQRGDTDFKGVYQHMYDTNFSRQGDFGTHYVVLAHVLDIGDYTPVSDDQHEEYRWMSAEEILADDTVHDYTKDYFR
jgi:colanic acid biosynthesis protein WcaH